MIIMDRDGSLTQDPRLRPDRTRASIEVPIDQIERQSDLIDRIITFAFDVLGLRAIELRVYEPDALVGARRYHEGI